MEANESTIKSLSIRAEPLWQTTVRVLENLSHLEIFMGQDMENIALVFRHAGQLEHLSILGLDNHMVFTTFENHPNSLPSLRSFKIVSHYEGWGVDVVIGEPELLSMAHFLEGRKELRALDLHLWLEEGVSFALFWDLVGQLPSLEVLGITTGFRTFGKADFLSFAAALPPKLSALRVSAQWDISAEGENYGCHEFVRVLSFL